jgi:hypothetical protein
MPNHLPDICGNCGSLDRIVLETRRTREHIRRRYKCKNKSCNYRWSTHESLAVDSIERKEFMHWIFNDFTCEGPDTVMLAELVNQREEEYNDCPLDIAGLATCILLTEKVSFVKQNLARVARISDEWSRIITAWPQLCSLLEEEAPAWRRSIGTIRAPRTLALLRSCL